MCSIDEDTEADRFVGDELVTEAGDVNAIIFATDDAAGPILAIQLGGAGTTTDIPGTALVTTLASTDIHQPAGGAVGNVFVTDAIGGQAPAAINMAGPATLLTTIGGAAVSITGQLSLSSYLKGFPLYQGSWYTEANNGGAAWTHYAVLTPGYTAGYTVVSTTDQRYVWASAYTPPLAACVRVNSAVDYLRFDIAGVYEIRTRVLTTGAPRCIAGCAFFTTAPPNPGVNDMDGGGAGATTGGVASVDLDNASIDCESSYIRGLAAGSSARVFLYRDAPGGEVICTVSVFYLGPDS